MKDRIVKILNYKKPSFWVVVASVVVCVVVAVCFLTDPIKKREDKPEKEAASSSAVTSSEDTSTKAEITVSEVTTSNEEAVSKPAESTAAKNKHEVDSEDINVEEKPNSNTNEPVITINDKIKTFDLETVTNIKNDYIYYLKSLSIYEDKEFSYSDIAITEYDTLSDGSLLIGICVKENYYFTTASVNSDDSWLKVQDINIYKNSLFKGVEEAYRTGLISKEVFDEVAEKYPNFIY